MVAKLVVDDQYSEPQLTEGIYADLHVLINQHERLNKDLSRVKNRIHNWVDRFFPEYTKVFTDREGKASLIT